MEWHSDIVWCHEVTELTTKLLERGASAGANFSLIDFEDLLPAAEQIKHVEGTKKKDKEAQHVSFKHPDISSRRSSTSQRLLKPSSPVKTLC